MKSMVDVEVILDEKYADPKVTIFARSRTEQVEKIIQAVETAGESEFSPIPGFFEDKAELISQRDILRVYTDKRRVAIGTAEKTFYTNKTLAAVEEMLNPGRFFRISQSEIINIYKVRSFEFNIAGTIGVELEDGSRTWVARSRVKAIKTMIKGEKE